MSSNSVATATIIIVFALLVLAGFYFVFDRMSSLKDDLGDLELQLKVIELRLNAATTTPAQVAPVQPNEPTPPATTTPVETTPTIQTAIIFNATSSSTLQPQTKLTVQVDKATRSTDGTFTLIVKVFTGEASSYSAFDPKEVLEVVNLTGDNTRASLVTGQFGSMPAKGAVTGTVVFTTDPSRSTVILQVGQGVDAKFYEFDFSRKVYRETVIG
jgi:hypothetical protein